jgi:hypothetical protein
MALIGYAASFSYSCSSCCGEQKFIYYRKYCMHAPAAVAAAPRTAASGKPKADAWLSHYVCQCVLLFLCLRDLCGCLCCAAPLTFARVSPGRRPGSPGPGSAYGHVQVSLYRYRSSLCTRGCVCVSLCMWWCESVRKFRYCNLYLKSRGSKLRFHKFLLFSFTSCSSCARLVGLVVKADGEVSIWE